MSLEQPGARVRTSCGCCRKITRKSACSSATRSQCECCLQRGRDRGRRLRRRAVGAIVLAGSEAMFLSGVDSPAPRPVSSARSTRPSPRVPGASSSSRRSVPGRGRRSRSGASTGRIQQQLRHWLALRPSSCVRASSRRTAAAARAGRPRGPLLRAAGRGAHRDDRHPRDVGDAAACLLTTPVEVHGAFVLTRPAGDHLRWEVAAELAGAHGPRRGVRRRLPTYDAAPLGLVQAGLPGVSPPSRSWPGPLRHGQGVNGEVTGTVESLTGRQPRGFGAFAREHAAMSGVEVAGTCVGVSRAGRRTGPAATACADQNQVQVGNRDLRRRSVERQRVGAVDELTHGHLKWRSFAT